MVAVTRCGAGAGVVLALAVVLAGSGLVGTAQAAPGSGGSFKIDVGIYEDFNSQNNPIKADPKDMQEFQFHVRWVITRTPVGVLPFSIPSETGDMGYYTSSQKNTVKVEKVAGQLGEHTVDYCVLPLPLVGYSYPADGFCLGLICQVKESISYEIYHNNIPRGYCPQYPDGQDQKKEGTHTENMKFYRGEVCGKVYPGWDGRFYWGACRPRHCYISIQ